jgi:protein-S-isoprenylcysteine O-methyltransferase Ste14
MPFMVTSSSSEALRMCLLLALANIGYYLRAKTEERHLLKSCPEYAVYCQALASKTVLARAATNSNAN